MAHDLWLVTHLTFSISRWRWRGHQCLILTRTALLLQWVITKCTSTDPSTFPSDDSSIDPLFLSRPHNS
eukprot:scaffold3505_cov98-Cylindrotheca_fusiformis.AAC.3